MATITIILIICIPVAYIYGYSNGRQDEGEIALHYLEMQGRTDPVVIQYQKKKRKQRVFREKPKKVEHKSRSWPKRTKVGKK